MNSIRSAFFFIFAVALMATASAQFVKGNEAVRVMPDGSKKVETPPTTRALLAKPCPAAQPSCTGGGWRMVETPSGLMECTESYARPSTCRASTYGTEKRSRLWVVKKDGEWLHCTHPELGRDCSSITKLPNPAVQ